MCIYEQDRFYVNSYDRHEIIWMYYNYDEGCTDQFVENHFDAALLEEAMEVCGDDADAIFDYIAENCTQYCADAGTWSYVDAKTLSKSEPLAIGTNEEALDEIRRVLKV